MTRQEIGLASRDVSRETIERLEHYERLLSKWNPRINLVAKSTLPDFWTRHVSDSAQLLDIVEPQGSWVDLGSGGGFPGLVIAILCAETSPQTTVTLVESDRRKSVFLQTVIRETGVAAKVICERIERLDPLQAGILSARALAPLPKLLDYAERHLDRQGTAVFPKGENWENEVSAARAVWKFDLKTVKSKTDPKAVILRIEGVERV